ncbi:MAG: biotin synthase BioB [Acidimicrobiales bacterium]|jgi:biotin synthase|nr:biotin synthase BioB [Acidimicrobiales bacterium]
MHEPRYDWTIDEVLAVIERPFHDLLADAHGCHVERFRAHEIEAAKLLSIKTGGCPEDCAYCPQSAHHDNGLKAEPLMKTAEILEAAKEAKAEGATRFCMGAAWREPSDKQLDQVAESVSAVAELGMETCVTLGMLTDDQAGRLANAGLDFYNHNLDTAPDFYGEIITTRTYQERIDTLGACRDAGIALCTGGIVGMGETRRQRASLLTQLAQLDPHPESVPINLLIQVEGTPMNGLPEFPPLELVRTIAAARLVMPTSVVRLSAGRASMSEELHALCLHAGASSIFLGERLLTADNAGEDADQAILEQLDTALKV